MTRLLYVVGDDRYVKTHRLPLMERAAAAGYDVHLACPPGPFLSSFSERGITLHPLHSFNRSGMNPANEWKTFVELYRLYGALKPHIVHHAALKPCLYGTFIARLKRVPLIINTFGGMGYIFTHNGIKTRLVRLFLIFLYRLLMKTRRVHVTVQNPDDYALSAAFARPENHHLIRGSGVDLTAFPQTPLPPVDDRGPIGVFAARFLRDKGIYELIDAIKVVKKKGIPGHFIFAGSVDPANPSSIPVEHIQEWVEQGLISCVGLVDDMAALYQSSHFAILPSYREGLPKTLLEAAATGRALITTDVPGCREMIDGNGILVPPRDFAPLATAIEFLLTHPASVKTFGDHSRKRAESLWDSHLIIDQNLNIYFSYA